MCRMAMSLQTITDQRCSSGDDHARKATGHRTPPKLSPTLGLAALASPPKKDEGSRLPLIGIESMNTLLSLPAPLATLEPRPITDQGILKAVDIVNDLPLSMITSCDEFIEALSHITSPEPEHEADVVNSSLLVEDTLSSNSQCSAPASPVEEDRSMRIHPYQHERWMERYQDLVDYYQRNGHCNVPYVYKANPCLGQWVKRQRHQHKLRNQGHHSNLTEDRIKMLDMLGFIWDSHGAAWEEKFQELKEFWKSHGHCNVPCIYNGNSKLSTWLKRQRRQYRLFVGNKPSTMDYERIAKLENLGFVWDYYGGKSSVSTKLPKRV